MTKRSETSRSITIRLDAEIDHEDQLRVSFLDAKSERIPLRADRGLSDLVLDAGEGPITLEVKNFFQRGAVYEVFGAILEDNGHTIAAYWQPTETGQQYTLPPLSEKDPAKIKLLIGALSRCPGAVVPTPLTTQPRPDGYAFPVRLGPGPKDPLKPPAHGSGPESADLHPARRGRQAQR